MKPSTISVAKYFEQQLALCGRSQKDVAADCGYGNANIITMFKNGTTKIPLSKVGVIAKALGIDPTYFLRLAMTEYAPKAWDAIEQILGFDNMMSAQEIELAKFIRESTVNMAFDLSIMDNRKVLEGAIRDIITRDQARGLAAVARLESRPTNSRHR